MEKQQEQQQEVEEKAEQELLPSELAEVTSGSPTACQLPGTARRGRGREAGEESIL